MYAVLRQGSHQYRVQPGDTIQIEKIEAEKGEEITLEDVLALSNGSGLEVGAPRVLGASIRAKVLRQDRGPKIDIYKFKRRKNEARRRGHRQPFTEIKIIALAKNGNDLA